MKNIDSAVQYCPKERSSNPTYHIATNEELSLGYGINPAKITRTSKAKYSRLAQDNRKVKYVSFNA